MSSIQFSVIDESCAETNGCTSGESWCEDEPDGNYDFVIFLNSMGSVLYVFTFIDDN